MKHADGVFSAAKRLDITFRKHQPTNPLSLSLSPSSLTLSTASSLPVLQVFPLLLFALQATYLARLVFFFARFSYLPAFFFPPPQPGGIIAIIAQPAEHSSSAMTRIVSEIVCLLYIYLCVSYV